MIASINDILLARTKAKARDFLKKGSQLGFAETAQYPNHHHHSGILPLWVCSPGLVRISAGLALTLEETFWKVLESIEKYWKVLKSIGKCWKSIGSIERDIPKRKVLNTRSVGKTTVLYMYYNYLNICVGVWDTYQNTWWQDERLKYSDAAVEVVLTTQEYFCGQLHCGFFTQIVIFYTSLSWGINWGWCDTKLSYIQSICTNWSDIRVFRENNTDQTKPKSLWYFFLLFHLFES